MDDQEQHRSSPLTRLASSQSSWSGGFIGAGIIALGLIASQDAAVAQATLPLEQSPAYPTSPSIPASRERPDGVLPGGGERTQNPTPAESAPQFPLTLQQMGTGNEPDFETYRLGPGDSIFIGVQRFPELSFEATLDLRGNIIVPLAGAVNLQGLTLDAARNAIFDAYNRYVVNPDVSITLVAQRPVQVTIVGEVAQPGFYPLQAPQLSTALLTAGGTTMQADLREVHIRRDLSQADTVEQTVDLYTPLYRGEAIPNVRLQDGDVIRVGHLDPARAETYDRDLVAHSTLAKPEITVRILNHAAGNRGTQAQFTALTLRNGSRFLDALAQAGVNPDLAAYDRIAVLRFNPEKRTADTIMVDARAAVNGDGSQNIAMQENDVIVVDRNLLAQVTYGLNILTQPFRDALGFLLFFETLDDIF